MAETATRTVSDRRAKSPTEATQVSLVARGTLLSIAGVSGTVIGDRELADLDGDGIFDVGDGLVVNLSEPFDDANDNAIFDAGESFSDFGLDGVAASGDFGEENGQFDYDPDRARWIAEDPLTRVAASQDIATQRVYMDVGTEDEFEFEQHYTNFVAVLRAKGLTVVEDSNFQGNCVSIPETSAQYFITRYDGGHVGVDAVDPGDLFSGDVCGETIIWQRLRSLIGYVNESFPGGFFGVGDEISFPPDLDPTGDIVTGDLPSPALEADGGATPMRPIVVYRPPAYFHSDESFPIVYFLGGYGQEPEDFERIQLVLDTLIIAEQIQNMYFAFLPGDGGRKGSFYVNHVVPDSQVPGITEVTSGRYEDSIMQDLIPVIENQILEGRIAR